MSSWLCPDCGNLLDTPNHELGCSGRRRKRDDVIPYGAKVVIDVRSVTTALRDMKTLLDRGDWLFVSSGLGKLADRCEEMFWDSMTTPLRFGDKVLVWNDETGRVELPAVVTRVGEVLNGEPVIDVRLESGEEVVQMVASVDGVRRADW